VDKLVNAASRQKPTLCINHALRRPVHAFLQAPSISMQHVRYGLSYSVNFQPNTSVVLMQPAGLLPLAECTVTMANGTDTIVLHFARFPCLIILLVYDHCFL
jgi:hypothetical protein